MPDLKTELQDQIKIRQNQWDAGEYPHPESVFHASMESDNALLSMLLRQGNTTVVFKRQVAVPPGTCRMDSVVTKTKRKTK